MNRRGPLAAGPPGSRVPVRRSGLLSFNRLQAFFLPIASNLVQLPGLLLRHIVSEVVVVGQCRNTLAVLR